MVSYFNLVVWNWFVDYFFVSVVVVIDVISCRISGFNILRKNKVCSVISNYNFCEDFDQLCMKS